MKSIDEDQLQLKAALDQLEQLTYKEAPPAEWFSAFVTEQKAAQARRARRDLLLFLAVAPLVILLTMMTMTRGVGAFLIMQPIVLGAISLPVLLRKRKRVDV